MLKHKFKMIFCLQIYYVPDNKNYEDL